MKNSEHVEAVLEYILEHEREDFYENPDKTHVFFHAVAELQGVVVANEMLQNALDEN